MLKLTAALLASLIAVSVAADAAASPETTHAEVRGSWVQLGSRTVSGATERDGIDANKPGPFASIEIRANGTSMWIDDIKVIYGDGQTWEPHTRVVFDKDARTHAFDLPGGKHNVKRVEFKYGDVPGGGGGRASLDLWGKDG